MNHPELVAVPVLMLADYLLTILGAKLSRVVYRNHFTTPSYELNPLWRKSVDRLQWFNFRHLLAVVLVTAMLVLVDQRIPHVSGFMIGALLGVFGAVCGRHLSNLLIFSYVNRHPQEIAGQVQLSMKLLLKISQYNYMAMIPLFILVAALVPSHVTIGVVCGMIAIVFVHFLWSLRAKSATRSTPVIQAELADSQHDLDDTLVVRLLIPVGLSGWAIASGYLGLFSVLLLPAPLALATGILAIRQMRRNPKKHGMGRAVFGIVMGSLGSILLAAVLVSMLAPLFR